MNYQALPAINATLNGTSAILLVIGWRCIRAQRIAAHRLCMTSALATSTLFLVSYLTYHAHSGSKHFPGAGIARTAYVAILSSHTLLALVIVPLVLRTFTLAIRQQFATHRAWARWTFPLWLYVSVTGVIIYWMLYRMDWSASHV